MTTLSPLLLSRQSDRGGGARDGRTGVSQWTEGKSQYRLRHPVPGQTAGESLADGLNSTFGFTGLQNVYAVGSAVAREILSQWGRWRNGPPPLS